MNNAQQMGMDRFRAELEQVRAEIEKLKAQAGKAKASQGIRFNEYLDAIEEKREQTAGRLDDLKNASGQAFDEIRAGIKDARDRLAIARRAAQSRFH